MTLNSMSVLVKICIVSLVICCTEAYQETKKCENITIPFCKDLPYTTVMPNFLGHLSQEDAALDLQQFSPLVNYNASNPDLRHFLCAYYLPFCLHDLLGEAQPVYPCRELCERARNFSEKLMKNFGFSWPERLECSQFPYHKDYSRALLFKCTSFDQH